MKSTIDRSGRIVVPKAIRDRLGLKGGEPLDVIERDGVIELRPAALDVEIIETSEGSVAKPKAAVEVIDDETVRNTLERIRR